MKIFKINKYCRLCNSAKLEKVVQIGDTPVSEKYSDSKDQKPNDSLVPLDLYYCLECGHVQIIHVVNPDFLWDKFTFKTSRNLKISQHYQNYVQDLVKFSGNEEKKFVIDIGSNDGTLLKIFKNNGFKKVLFQVTIIIFSHIISFKGNTSYKFFPKVLVFFSPFIETHY